MSGEELERAERLQKYLLLRGGALVLKVALWQAAHCNEGVAAGRESAPGQLRDMLGSDGGLATATARH